MIARKSEGLLMQHAISMNCSTRILRDASLINDATGLREVVFQSSLYRSGPVATNQELYLRKYIQTCVDCGKENASVAFSEASDFVIIGRLVSIESDDRALVRSWIEMCPRDHGFKILTFTGGSPLAD